MLSLDQRVEVGGCVGKVSELTETEVVVRGTYYYVGGPSEPWRFVYDRRVFEKDSKWNEEFEQWDAQDITPNSYF